MHTLFNLTRFPRESFPKHFLNAVYAEIRFNDLQSATILSNKEQLIVAMKAQGFQESRDLFEQEMVLDTKNKNSPTLSQKNLAQTGLAFISESPKRVMHINKNALIISDFNYDCFEGFSARLDNWVKVICSITELNEESVINKIGLRKVSSIFISPIITFDSALSVFNTALFGIARSGLLKEASLNVSEEAVRQEVDGNLCILKTQLKKKTPDVLEAILDFDLVSLVSTSYNESFRKKLSTMNDVHFDLFMWATTDHMRELMRNSNAS